MNEGFSDQEFVDLNFTLVFLRALHTVVGEHYGHLSHHSRDGSWLPQLTESVSSRKGIIEMP